MSGIILGNIFIVAFIVFVFTASFAVFIPGAPFHSPLSDFIRLIFQTFPNWSIFGLVRVRTVCVALFFVTFLVLSIVYWFLNLYFNFYFVILCQFLVPISLLSLYQGSQGANEAREQPKPLLFSLATWLYFHSIFFICFSFASFFTTSLALYVFFNSLRGVILLVMIVGAMKMSRWTPDKGKAKAEAVAWMIKTQPSQNLLTFQNAVEIARNSPHLRSTLLAEIHPILDVLITSIRGEREQDLKDDEKIYINLLAVLVDFEPCKASIWRNEAAMKRSELSNELKEKLRNLRKGCDGHSLPLLSGCAKADAEFILGKVKEAEESGLVGSHSAVDIPLSNSMYERLRH